ncbi:MAG: pilus assembly protein PilM [Spirochaetes bacterium]|nr:pilus assembly protein PilM [Spirochaetota bacterium]MBN2770648.1 pilus assembly protein PilM [Spirochaetota bacterium]
MFEKLLAIDIGTSSIKALSAKRGFKSNEILHFSHRMINPESADQQAEIEEALTDLMSEFTDNDYLLITNIPLKSVILRNFSFPFSEKSKISEILPMEAEETLPYDLDDIDISFQLANEGTEEGKIIAAAIQKEHLNQFKDVIGTTGITPHYIGIESNSLFESLLPETLQFDSFLQIDIGHSKTTVNLVHGKKIASTRLIPGGCSSIISKMASILKINYYEAFGKFENLHLDLSDIENNYSSNFYKSLKITKKQLQEIYDFSILEFESIIDQIRLTIQAFTAANHSVDFERIYLSGGASLLPRISDFFANAMEIPVGSLPNMQLPNQIAQARFSSCYGLIELYRNKTDYINFCENHKNSSFGSIQIEKLYPALFFTSLSAIMLIIVLILNLFFTSREKALTRDLLQKQYTTLFKSQPTDDDPIISANRLLKKELDKLNQIRNLIPEENSTIELISAISAQMPEESDIEIQSLVISDKDIKMSGTVETSSTLSDFMTKLKAVSLFESAIDRTTSTGSISRFSIEIKLKQNTAKKGKTK